jgi:general secretion pathway protein B
VSYILDALRKAQGERARGPAGPEIATENGQPVLRTVPPERTLVLTALAGGVAGGLLCLLVWALWPDRATVAPPPAVAPAHLSAAAAPQPALRSLDDLAVPGPGVDSADLAALEPGADEFVDLPEPEPAIAPEAGPEQKPEPAPAEPAAAPTAPVDAAPSNASGSDPAPPPAAVAAASPRPPVQTVALRPAEPIVRELKDMPESYRTAFPRLRLEVHVYNDDPARRFVLVDGRQYREWQTLAQGPQIAEITPDGAIVSFRNEEVLITAY